MMEWFPAQGVLITACHTLLYGVASQRWYMIVTGKYRKMAMLNLLRLAIMINSEKH